MLRGDTPEKSFGGGANDKLAARGELGTVFADSFGAEVCVWKPPST
jgi:hypothetical protein